MGFYSSRHLVEVHRIISIYKRNKAIRNGSAVDKFLFKRNPPLLHKLGLVIETKIEEHTPIKTAPKPKVTPEDTAAVIKLVTGVNSTPTTTRNIIDGKVPSTMHVEGSEEKSGAAKNQIQPAPAAGA